MRRLPKAFLAFLLVLSFGLVLFVGFKITAPSPLTIAVVLQSEQDRASTQDVLTGIRAALKEAAYDPALKGREIQLQVEFDHDDPEQAEAIAQKLAQDQRIVAVLGHDSSNTSIAAGAVYQRQQLPAITWSATAEQVTVDNPWYFRAIYNNTSQGTYLAQYISKKLGQPKVAIIYNESDPYSRSLHHAFAPAFKSLGGQITQTYTVKEPRQSTNAAQDYARQAHSVAASIQQQPPEAVNLVVLLTGSGTSPPFVTALKNRGIELRVFGGSALGSSTFVDAFKDLTERQPHRPLGFYTNGIHSVVPFFFDMLGPDGAHLRAEYYETYAQAEPSWKLGTANDAAKFLLMALKNAQVAGQPKQIAQERQAIRQALADIDQHHAIPGISEPLYFDQRGDFPRTPAIGVLQQGQLRPAFQQLTPITVERSPAQLAREQQNGQIVQVGDQFFNQTAMIYTGILPQDIREIDLDHQTFDLDFEVWFRYPSDVPESVIRDVRFLNAAADIKLDAPESSVETEGMIYSRYKAQGTFRLNTLNQARLGLGEQILGVSFVNNQLSHRSLIYVTDSLGLGFGDSRATSLAENLTQARILQSQDWRIKTVTFFQKSVAQDLLGTPFYQSTAGYPDEFSQMNLAIKITPNELTLRRAGNHHLMLVVLIGNFLLTAFLITNRYTRVLQLNSRWTWLLIAIASCAFVYAAESLLLHWLTNLPTVLLKQVRLGNNPLPNLFEPAVMLLTSSREFFVAVFDILWWLLCAYLINAAVNCFIWQPLESTTQNKIPTLVYRLVSYVIYLFTLFAIWAYVFGNPLTSLLATSGLALGIIGLAVQINISNIFSGLAINLEGSFKVGDFIEIPAQKLSGYVEDINWRATRIRTRTNNMLLIPNSDINSQTIINYMIPNDASEIAFTFTLEPGTDKALALMTLDTAIQTVAQAENSLVLSAPAPLVRITDTSIYGVNYTIYCWYRPAETSNSKVGNVVNQSVLEHLLAAEIRLSSSVQVRPLGLGEDIPDPDDDFGEG
ncbi:MAG: ABC transporter substrate-binding protein [Spirulina sp. SIO3F2]|nr:ABC transporter substrate-binding protein [Spirulina sp. SIO3F2]